MHSIILVTLKSKKREPLVPRTPPNLNQDVGQNEQDPDKKGQYQTVDLGPSGLEFYKS